MSRVGSKPIELPAGLEVQIVADHIKVKGVKGELISPSFEGIEVKHIDNSLSITRADNSKKMRSLHGLVRSLLQNCVIGVSSGFSRNLVLEGVGYRAQKKGNTLVLSLGYSHDINFEQPSDVQIEVPEPTKVNITGIDKQRVGQVAAQIREFRKPEPYKGKGVRYHDEKIQRKAGKAGKK